MIFSAKRKARHVVRYDDDVLGIGPCYGFLKECNGLLVHDDVVVDSDSLAVERDFTEIKQCGIDRGSLFGNDVRPESRADEVSVAHTHDFIVAASHIGTDRNLDRFNQVFDLVPLAVVIVVARYEDRLFKV